MANKEKLQEELDAWTERDLGAAAAAGELAPAFEQDEAVERLDRILIAGRSPVLTGDRGVGKTVLLHQLVRRAAAGHGPPVLHGKRVLQFSIRRRASSLKEPRLVGGRLAELTDALARLGGDVVPYFRDFHLAWTFDLESHFETLAFRLENPLLCEGLRSGIESMFEYNPDLEQHYVVHHLEEPDLDHARRILRAWAESSDGPRFEAAALETALQISHRFLARSHLPRKALEPLRQLSTLHHDAAEIDEAKVLDRFCDSYLLPRFLVDAAVPLDLDELEGFFASRLLGQEEAVSAVVDMISLIKAGLCDPRRPFGVFLFVGPTGVGKTHLAQLLATYLFATPERMVRFNMADHADERSSLTLFGDPDDSRLSVQRGILTQRIMGHPFAVLLLDEFEKASAKVHDRFLQLFDEGSFINGAGESISCRSFIIIATSNAGAELWRGGLMGFAGSGDPEALNRALDRRLHETFRFEFLNRFDRVVHFRPLDRRAIRTIASRELEQLERRTGFEQRQLALEVDAGLLDWLTVHGYDPHHGARFLRRTIEREITTALASLLVRENPPPGARVELLVRRGHVGARVASSSEAPAKREPVTLPLGTTEQVKSLDRERLLAEADSLLAAARRRLADLAGRRDEYRTLLARLNEPGFWDDAPEEVLDRFRELDVAIQVEGRLARPLERLAETRRPGDGSEPPLEAPSLETLARAVEAAAASLREWDERSAEEGASAVWLVISRIDPLTAAGGWVADLAAMELSWCRQIGLRAEIVATGVSGSDLAQAVLEVEGLGAEVLLEMENGAHRLSRAQGGDLRARVEVLRRSDAPASKVEVRSHPPRPGRLDLEAAAAAELEIADRGEVLRFEATDARLLAHLLADLDAAGRERPPETPELARIYNEDGIGARDPRTGAVVPRLKKVLRGHLDRLLEGWRRRPR